MVDHIRKKKPTLPIKPTSKPSPQDMAVVAMHLINVVQNTILSPASVIGTLSCALELYKQNAVAIGFDPKVADECSTLGLDLAKALRASGAVKSRAPIATSDTPLMGPNGEKLELPTMDDDDRDDEGEQDSGT